MKKFLSIAVAFVAAVVMIGTNAGLAEAQSRGLGITPRRDLTVQPGKSVTDKVTVTNLNGTEDLALTLNITDFGAKDETGTPSLQLDESKAQTPWSLKPFIDAPESVIVKPNESKTVEYKVSIPSNQGAGSYYSAIRYVAEAEDGGQVAIGASGATLVFVTVPGKTKESLIVDKFGAYATNKYQSVFIKTSPNEMAYTLKNQGNVAEQPAGSIEIKNMFGKRADIVEDANPKASLALREQTRRFQVCIQGQKSEETVACKETSYMPGRYTATLNAFYGINGNQTQEILTTASFWYLPVWFLIVLGVVVLAVASTVYIIYRRITGRHGFKKR